MNCQSNDVRLSRRLHALGSRPRRAQRPMRREALPALALEALVGLEARLAAAVAGQRTASMDMGMAHVAVAAELARAPATLACLGWRPSRA